MLIAAYVLAAAVLFWLGMIFAHLGGLIFVALAAVLVVLKLTGIFVWSWWWVALALWAALGGGFLKIRVAARDPRL